MKHFDRASLAVIILAVILWAMFLAFVGLRFVFPSDGLRLQPGTIQSNTNGLSITPLGSSIVQPNDTVVAINGQSVESWVNALPDFGRPAQWTFDQPLIYTVVRGGEQLDIPVKLGPYPIAAILARDWGALLFAIVNQIVVAFVFFRRPNEPVARIGFVASASMVSATTWSFGLQLADILNRIGFWLYVLTTVGAYMLVWASVLHATLIFPTRWPLLERQRWIVPLIYIAPYAALGVYTFAFLTQITDALNWFNQVGALVSVTQLTYLLLAIAAAVRGYRAAHDSVSLRQVRWIIAAFLITFISAITFGMIPELILGYPLVSWNVMALIGLSIPIAFAFAILRYRLFDIDGLLNRTLVYGTLTGIVVALYVILVGVLSTLFQLTNNLTLSLIVTALVAIIFQPLRERLQRAVNRLMYGDRDDPYAILSRLGQRLESTLAPDTILPTIVETVAQALKLPYAAIILRDSDTDKVAAAYGLPTPHIIALPLTHQRETVGQLRVAQRSPNESFTPIERRLLEDIARQIEVAIHNVRLTVDLQKSRERLVTTREEERRRLRRDLHDGLGPTLAGQAYKLDAVLDLIAQDPETARKLVTDLKTQTQNTLADIRRLVYQLRPAALDELGLVAALQAQFAHSANGLRINIESPSEGLPSLSAAVEVAAYRIAAEAVNNTMRHANAHLCIVRLAVKDSTLEVEITDDGSGIPAGTCSGVGLSSMRERATELGGVCVIEPLSGGGTKVEVRLPLAHE